MSDAFEIVGRAIELYTLFYAEKGIVLLYEVLCGLGGFVWGSGVFSAGAVCGLEGLHGLVLCADHVRDAERRLGDGPGIETF